MKAYFLELAGFVQSLAAAGEVIASNFAAETSDFIRFNRSAVRQATSVRQIRWTLTLIQPGPRAAARKCSRCWCWPAGVGSAAAPPEVCPRCAEALATLGGGRRT